MQHLPGFAPLADRYDGFILDLWGVIHDGVNAFPHAIDTLSRLKAAGKRTLLLSNAPRTNDAVQAMMRRMGIADSLYTGILTSGEAVRRALLAPPDIWWTELGTRVFHLGPMRDRPVIDGLPLTLAETPAGADFVLNTGPDDHRNPSDMAEFEDLLQACARVRLKMICANPDLEVIRGGVRVLCAGSLAARYQELGGDVRSLGKPDPAIYQPVLQDLGVPPAKVLAVGDSLRTDIAGATGVDLAACWVLDGIHGDALSDGEGDFDGRKAEAMAAQANLRPLATLPRFVW
ncbi:MAG TPA: TIGR01459 family HAD-type hydrolase [Rhodopila sp.]|uniref:TIGR01459 family HAD-type hydrolase n=1 Tax=Rhodopila sp. TaxID=2480087 RepID=UPI002BBDD8A6|nr:TIGR01459 family HAD-type hydrolase [Rhodopila sp.]HVY16156.1 TIGR01459 family HAD-type hydrolase [Rhodopila sp.]